MKSPVSIIYCTHRREPHFDWFADSLAVQLERELPEVIVVDGLHSSERAARLREIVAGRFPLRHVPPKPTPYCGPHRLTRRDYYALASARNTGAVYASEPYLVFIDDCSVLMPGWWAEVRTAARAGYVVGGAYHAHWSMIVDNGALLESRQEWPDSRWPVGDDHQVKRLSGSELYGGNFGLPRELLLSVNGVDELCDPAGTEDYHLGFRLEYAGAPIFFSRRMLMIKSSERHDDDLVIRVNRKLDAKSYMARLNDYRVTQRVHGGPYDAVSLILDILKGTRSPLAMGNYYSLRGLTEGNLDQVLDAFPRASWVDQRPLSEL